MGWWWPLTLWGGGGHSPYGGGSVNRNMGVVAVVHPYGGGCGHSPVGVLVVTHPMGWWWALTSWGGGGDSQ